MHNQDRSLEQNLAIPLHGAPARKQEFKCQGFAVQSHCYDSVCCNQAFLRGPSARSEAHLETQAIHWRSTVEQSVVVGGSILAAARLMLRLAFPTLMSHACCWLEFLGWGSAKCMGMWSQHLQPCQQWQYSNPTLPATHNVNATRIPASGSGDLRCIQT